MDYRELSNLACATLISVVEAAADMGIDIPLLWNRMTYSMENSLKGILKDANIDFSGNTAESIAKNFADNIKKLGACQRVDLREASNNKIVIALGDCIFNVAAKYLRHGKNDFIPLCPITAILGGRLEAILDKKVHIEQCEWHPEINSCVFTLLME